MVLLPLLPAHRGLTVLIPKLPNHSQVSWALQQTILQILSTFIRYSLFAALSGLMGEGLAPYLPQITTLMLISLRSTEGIVVSRGWVYWAG